MIGEKSRSYRWVVVFSFWGMAEAAQLVVMSIGIMLPAMTRDLNMSPTEGGMLATVFWLAIGTLSIPVSNLLSRYSPKHIITGSILMSGLFTLLQGWAPNYEIELAARTGFVIALVARTGVFAIIVQQWFETREVTTVQSISTGLSNIAGTVAVAFTPFWMGLVGGWRGALYTYGIILVLSAINWHFIGRDRETPSYLARLRSQERTPMRSVLKYKELWLIGFGFMGGMIGWVAFLTFWPTFLLEERGIPLTTGGFVLGFLPLGSIIGSFAAGFAANKLGLNNPIIILGGIAAVVTRLGMLWSDSMPILAALSFVQGILIFLPTPVMLAVPYGIKGIKPREIAVGAALISTIMTFGSVISPMVVARIYESTGTLYMALFFASFGALTYVLSGFLLEETGWRARRKEVGETPAPDLAS